jgi:predicted TIM-barrel fold metal-dependent hydrolase
MSTVSGSLIESLDLVSGDSHVVEPRNLWRDNLPPSLRSKALRGIKPGEAGAWEVVLEGEDLDANAEAEPERMKTADPEHRYSVMRKEGIVAECIFPTTALYIWLLEDREVQAASCRVYNEWIASGLGRFPRFKCAGLVPTASVDDAIAEVAWIADAGLGSIMLPVIAAPDWNHRTWDPLWSAIEETGLPAVMHQGTGHSMFFYRGAGAGVSNLVATQSMAPRTAALLANAGVFEFHPKLHVVFVEYNVGWLGWLMDTADFYTESFAKYGVSPEGRKWINPELPELPSHYLRHQVHATFQNDAVAIHNLPLTGAASLIWGSDYPHQEGTYPHSRDTVVRLAKDLDDDVTTRVFRTNAAELFHFSDDVLTTPV